MRVKVFVFKHSQPDLFPKIYYSLHSNALFSQDVCQISVFLFHSLYYLMWVNNIDYVVTLVFLVLYDEKWLLISLIIGLIAIWLSH